MSRQSLVRCGLVAPILLGLLGCTASYREPVRPPPRLGALSPELAGLTDAAIETYLHAEVRPVLPTTLAVARLEPPYVHERDADATPVLAMFGAGEGELWRSLAADRAAVDQVQLVSPLLAGGDVTLKRLREAAALLHAPLLLVYQEFDDHQEGYNESAMAYWTFVGLFCVPGDSVGHYTVAQALLIDTQSGYILATAAGEARSEERVLPGAVPIARDRVTRAARSEALHALVKEVRATLVQLRGRSSPP